MCSLPMLLSFFICFMMMSNIFSLAQEVTSSTKCQKDLCATYCLSTSKGLVFTYKVTSELQEKYETESSHETETHKIKCHYGYCCTFDPTSEEIKVNFERDGKEYKIKQDWTKAQKDSNFQIQLLKFQPTIGPLLSNFGSQTARVSILSLVMMVFGMVMLA